MDAWAWLVVELGAYRKPREGFQPGERHPKAKLSSAQVALVFRLHARGQGPTEIAQRVGIQKSGVSKILNGHRRRLERQRWIFHGGK